MPRDVVVRFRKSAPSSDVVHKLILDYFGNAASSIRWLEDRWYVRIRGRLSFPMLRVGPATENQRRSWKELMADKRRFRDIEIWSGVNVFYVMTRMVDPLTNALADGFATLLARGFGGKVER